jgi:hypothetical protein
MSGRDTTVSGNGEGERRPEWLSFPGGELEGERPVGECPACRERRGKEATNRRPDEGARTLCFQCYRAGWQRERAIRAAGERFTASAERFAALVPFEAVDARRLGRLKMARAETRTAAQSGARRFESRRRRAQIAARHAVSAGTDRSGRPASVAGLPLPAAWLPFAART